MTQTPLVEAEDLPTLGTIRLLYVPSEHVGPEKLRRVPIEEWVSHAKQSRSGLDDTIYWHHAIGSLGIGPDAPTVVLDDGRMTEAARVWFILQYFGMPAVVLNGGAPALGSLPQDTPDHEGTVALRPGSGSVGLHGRDDLKSDLARVQVFDARSAAEFRGEDLMGNARGGHLPGPHHLAHADLLNGSRLKPATELAAMMDAAGIDGSKPIVSHCNGGGRAALAALAAAVAGRPKINVYYLSFADWAADDSCPIHRLS
jgi:thiosulfate/3-mercaptopyruvate sulfurtransferase